MPKPTPPPKSELVAMRRSYVWPAALGPGDIIPTTEKGTPTIVERVEPCPSGTRTHTHVYVIGTSVGGCYDNSVRVATLVPVK